MLLQQLSRKYYHVILMIIMGCISLYDFLFFFTFSRGFIRIHTEYFQLLLIAFIILYETANSKKTLRIINTVALSLAFIGALFTVQHWPFGRMAILISFLIILVCLFINAIKYSQAKIIGVIILLYPIIHFIAISASLFRLPFRNAFWVLNVVVMLFVSISLGIHVLKERKKS